MSPEATAIVVIGALVGFAALAWWAKRQGRAVQAALDKATSAANETALKEKSNEIREAADSRRDPGLHAVPDRVPESSIPDWLKR